MHIFKRYIVFSFIISCIYSSVLHCSGVQVSIKTPYALKQMIIAADVTAFKTAYALCMKSGLLESATARQSLATVARETKEKLEKERNALGDNKISKKALAKGAVQTALGLWGLGGVALTYWIQYQGVITYRECSYDELKDKNFAEQDTYVARKIINKMPSVLYPFLAVPLAMELAATAGNKLTGTYSAPFHGTSWWDITPLIPGGFPFFFLAGTTYVSGKSLVCGWKNIKIGLDYNAYLKQKIKNIDEISACIDLSLRSP